MARNGVVERALAAILGVGLLAGGAVALLSGPAAAAPGPVAQRGGAGSSHRDEKKKKKKREEGGRFVCDVGYVVRSHVPALMQLVTADPRVRELYNMRLITTKCLNTAVMMMHLVLGSGRALRRTLECDVEEVRAASEGPGGGSAHHRGAVALKTDAQATVQPASRRGMGAMELLRRAVMTKDSGRRVLYYVMLTNGDMPPVTREAVEQDAVRRARPGHDGGALHFPGHVFVIERLPRDTFHLYQSYIDNYDMSAPATRAMGAERMRAILDGLVYIATRGRVWDAECTRVWRDLTLVDASRYEGSSAENILPCYRRVATTRCLGKLRSYVRGKLRELERRVELGQVGEGEVYPSDAAAPGLFARDSPVLTVGEMRGELRGVLESVGG